MIKNIMGGSSRNAVKTLSEEELLIYKKNHVL